MVRRFPRLSGLFLLAACTGTPPSHSSSTDSAGVAIVTGPAADAPFPWTLTEVRRLGGADSGAASFASVSERSVRTDGRDRIVVLDWAGMQRIHVFDSAGALRHSLSAKGSGPGEMQFPLGVTVDRDGAVVAIDMAKQATLTWGTDGVLRGERPWPKGKPVPWGMPAFAGDTLFTMGMDQDTTARWQVLRRWTPIDSVTIDSLSGPPMKMTMLSCAALLLAPLFTPDLLWAQQGAVVATSRRAAYVIDLHDGTAVRRSIRRDIAPAPTTAADAARLYPEGMKLGDCTIPAAEIAEKAGMAAARPTIAGLRFGPGGMLWVQRAAVAGAAPTLDVFDPDGGYLGTLAGRPLPLGFLGDDLVLFPVKDDATGGTVIGIFRMTRTP